VTNTACVIAKLKAFQVSDEYQLPAGSVPRFEPPRPVRYTLSDLVRESGASGRTIRYYISLGLLQPAYGRGKQATYDSDHLLRLQLIQRLKEERLPLNDIREQLSHLDSEDVARVLHVQLQPAADTWKRFALHHDLEISIRERPLIERSAAQEQAFDLIVEYARSVLQELERNAGG
jgi:DNA-binding transcriptional MerR regulator